MYTHKYICRHAQKHTYTLKASNFICNVVQLDTELCPVHWNLITYFMKNGVLPPKLRMWTMKIRQG